MMSAVFFFKKIILRHRTMPEDSPCYCLTSEMTPMVSAAAPRRMVTPPMAMVEMLSPFIRIALLNSIVPSIPQTGRDCNCLLMICDDGEDFFRKAGEGSGLTAESGIQLLLGLRRSLTQLFEHAVAHDHGRRHTLTVCKTAAQVG